MPSGPRSRFRCAPSKRRTYDLLSGDDKKEREKKNRKNLIRIFTLDPLLVDIACVYYDVLGRHHTIYIDEYEKK